MQSSAAAVVLSSLLAASALSATILSLDAELANAMPPSALEGVGCWIVGERMFVTGYSTSANSLGDTKAKRVERDFAEEDARVRVSRAVAHEQSPQFDEDSYSLSSEVSKFTPVATYRIEGREGLFLVGVVKRDAVHVRVGFDITKTRQNATAAFEAADFARAARLFAALTQHDVQDADTSAHARAASAHLNLAAGVTGATKLEALRELSIFYEKRNAPEMALRFYYQVYQAIEKPDRALLEKLAALSAQTYRESNAAAFRTEIERRWPSNTR